MLLGQVDTVFGMEMPLSTLIMLLYHLRSVYAMPSLQQKLQELRQRFELENGVSKGRCSYHATSLAYAQEQRDLLSEYQEPTFQMLRLPGPPLGIDLLQASVHRYRENERVTSLGGDCRMLLGQLSLKEASSFSLRDASIGKPFDFGLTGKTGYGIIATQSFAIGERIFLEEPLAVLHCGADVLSTPSVPAQLWRSGKVKKILESRLTSGPPKGPKVAIYSNFVKVALQQHGLSEQEISDVSRALCIFGFNAYALRGDRAQALYRCICMANHSCAPNAAIVTSADGPCELICIDNIEAGDEITVSYLSARDSFLDYSERQEQLYLNWEFRCCCKRCIEEKKVASDAA